MAEIIEINQLTKKFPGNTTPALDSISFQIQQGEKFGLFGPNGAGKTTLISLLCGILKADSGNIEYHIDGEKLTSKSVLPSIGFVPQDFAFYAELTPVQNLSYFGKLHKIPSDKLRQKIDFLLKAVGLDHVQNKKIQTFSGGMKRRINLAIGLINDPRILFLDEPTVGVDVQSKVAIINLLEELNKKGTTIIYTSHHLKEAEGFCDRIALLDHGKIIGMGDLKDLLTQNSVENLEELLIQLTGNTLRD